MLPDPWPLSHLLGALGARGRSGEIGDALGELLAGGDPIAVRQALRAIPPRRGPPALVRAVTDACASLPLERIEVLGLALQWLGEAAPEERRRLHEAAAERCREAALGGEAPGDGALLLTPGAALRALGAPDAGALGEALESFARRVLRTLGRGPRSLSQANAEELLARRVYEGRGHFLFELLQNADDARAVEVVVEVRSDELWLSHDGVPFDCRDVLGVLSVGLSTKQEGDIGLFGAGFKSVYAITERPRVYSGPYRFEIAGMSRPRPLAPPEGLPAHITRLALPLDRGVDAPALLAEALTLPPELLLTLRHVRRLVIEGGEGVRRALRRVDEGVETTLLDERGGEARRFVTARGGDAAPVLVALELDERGLPRAPPPDRPSVYCFLPTREEAGLPLLLHGAFDVPLDRERLRRDSPRNRRALLDAGTLLARLIEGLTPPRAEAAIVLLARARPTPFFSELVETARRHLGSAPLLLAAKAREALGEDRQGSLTEGGPRVPATRARRITPALAPVLAGLPLDDEGRVALAPLALKLGEAAGWLGATIFEPTDLLALLERQLRGVDEGAEAPGAWLVEGAAALASELGRLERGEERRRRDGLPWLVAEGGRCYRASTLRLATAAQAALYDGARPLRIEEREGGGPWAGVGVRRLDDRDVVADLHDEALRAAMLRRPDALLDYLAGLGPSLLAGLGVLPLVLEERGVCSPLVGPGALWLWPQGALGAWLATSPRPAMVAPATQAAHGTLLRALGGRELGVSELLDWLSKGPPLAAEQARELVAVAEREWRSWPPRHTEALLLAPVFLDVQGRPRPARGPGCALMPADDDIVALSPGLPWLEPEQRGFTLFATTPRLGAAVVVQSLAGEGPLFDEWPNLEAVLGYLEPRVSEVPEALSEALAHAPRWPASDGSRRPLRELSRPSNDVAIERFYASIGLRPRLFEGALRLASLLRLTDRLAPGGLDALIDDLAEGRIDPGHADLPSLLGQGAKELGAAALKRLSGVALFLAEDGALHPLSPWDAPRPSSPAGERGPTQPCHRAAAPFRRLLALGSRPLLAESEEGRWGPALLDALAGSAGPEEWVEALSHDLALVGLEAALVARATLLDATARRALEPFRRQLDARPLWRGGDETLRPAPELAIPDELSKLLGEPWEGLLPGEGVLHPQECAEAEALPHIFAFRPGVEFVSEQVKAQARLGQPLSEQVPLLSTAGRLARLRALTPEAGPLRVGVDGAGLLTSAELWQADADEWQLAAGLTLEHRLAHPALVSALPPGTLAPLPPVRLLDALAPTLRERGSIDDGAIDAERRATFYRWLERHGGVVEADEQARGLLGKLHAFATEDGARRCPRELLSAPALEALELPGRPAAEVPAAVRAWLARVYRLDDAALGPLVDALLDATARAAELGDGERASLLAKALADALTPPPGARPDEHEARVERALRAQRASRRLRVEAHDGSFVRPRALLLAPPEQRALLRGFHPSPPPALAERSGFETLVPLLRTLGARDQLSAEELAPLMTPGGRPPGFEASLALARYVALTLPADPSLRQHLDLDRAAWVPAADATLKPPTALFWPEPGLDELLGPRPDALPHPLFARTLPPAFGRRLRFRRAADASLDDVLRPLVDGEAAPVETLRWLEDALRAGTIEPAALRQALGARRVFLDTRGEVRAFAALGVGQDGRPIWADHERWPELSVALRLNRRPSTAASAPQPASSASTPDDASTTPNSPASASKPSLWQRWFGGGKKPAEPPAPAPSPSAPPSTPTRPPPQSEAPPRRELPPPSETPRHEARPRAEAPTQPQRRAKHEAWYRPSDAIHSQLDGAGGWSEARKQRPRYGFAIAPGTLPPPYLYAPRMVAERFHAPTQRWERGDLPAEWSSPAARALSSVRFRGRAPAGIVLLPVPMYATLEALEVDGVPRKAVLGADDQWLVSLAEDADLSFEVALHEAPRFRDEPLELGPEVEPLLAPTAPDDELPRELTALVDELLASPLSPLARALRVRDFVRERYRYDPSYLEEERVARWLSQVTRGSANVHLAALHVGRGGRHLGAGVCYELNALACELLRRVGVPSALASGWVLEGGQVDEPDHLWALALLPSDLGPRFLPLDASSTRNGTPLRVARRPQGSFRARAPDNASPLPPPPAWAAQQPRGASPGALAPIGELARVARYLARQQGGVPLDEGTLRRRLHALLDDPDERQRLLTLLRGEDER